MSQIQQYYGVIAIRIGYIIFGSLIALFLFYESVNANNRVHYLYFLMTLFEAVFLYTSILATIFYASYFAFADWRSHILKIENKPLLWCNILIGIISFFYSFFKLLDNGMSGHCYQWYETFNNVAKIGFTLSLFLYLLITVQWRPDPDERKITLSAVGSGHLVYMSCLFICGRHLTMETQKILNGNSTSIYCYSEYRSSLLNISKMLGIFEILFTMISGTFIYFRLKVIVRHITKRQYYYTILVNTGKKEETSKTDNPPNPPIPNHEGNLWLRLFRTNTISCLISMLLTAGFVSNYILMFMKDVMFRNIYYNIGIVIILFLFSIVTIWGLYEVVQCPMEKTIRSKIDDFILFIGTVAEVFNALVQIKYCFNVLIYHVSDDNTEFAIILIVLNIINFIQIGIQRFLIIEILQRKITDIRPITSGSIGRLRQFMDPFLILCVVNLPFFVGNLSVYMLDGPDSNYDKLSVIINRILGPFLILIRLHGFTILVQVYAILNFTT